MANIERYGGTITITASTEPSPPNIVTTSVPDWVTVTSTGESWHATVSENTNASGRSGTVRVTINTASSSEYEPNSTATTAEWTVTQAGTGTTTYNIGIHLWGSDDGFTVSLYDANTHTLLGSYDNMVDSDLHSYTINNFGEICYAKVKKTNPGGSYTVGFVYSNDPQQGDVTEWRTIDGSDEVSFSDFTTVQGKSGGVFIL